MVKLTDNMNKVLIDMARTEKLDEVTLYQLCDKHELSYAEASHIIAMYQTAIENRKTTEEVALVPVKEAIKFDYGFNN